MSNLVPNSTFSEGYGVNFQTELRLNPIPKSLINYCAPDREAVSFSMETRDNCT